MMRSQEEIERIKRVFFDTLEIYLITGGADVVPPEVLAFHMHQRHPGAMLELARERKRKLQ